MFNGHYGMGDFQNMVLFKDAPPEWHAFVKDQHGTFAKPALQRAPLFILAWLFNKLGLRNQFVVWRSEHFSIIRSHHRETDEFLSNWFTDENTDQELVVVYQRRLDKAHQAYTKAIDACWERYYNMLIAKIEALNLLQK